jgi:hypothetical protein
MLIEVPASKKFFFVMAAVKCTDVTSYMRDDLPEPEEMMLWLSFFLLKYSEMRKKHNPTDAPLTELDCKTLNIPTDVKDPITTILKEAVTDIAETVQDCDKTKFMFNLTPNKRKKTNDVWEFCDYKIHFSETHVPKIINAIYRENESGLDDESKSCLGQISAMIETDLPRLVDVVQQDAVDKMVNGPLKAEPNVKDVPVLPDSYIALQRCLILYRRMHAFMITSGEKVIIDMEEYKMLNNHLLMPCETQMTQIDVTGIFYIMHWHLCKFFTEEKTDKKKILNCDLWYNIFGASGMDINDFWIDLVKKAHDALGMKYNDPPATVTGGAGSSAAGGPKTAIDDSDEEDEDEDPKDEKDDDEADADYEDKPTKASDGEEEEEAEEDEEEAEEEAEEEEEEEGSFD